MNEEIQKEIEKLENDIGSVEIQGATNVAFATLEGMKLAARASDENILENVESVGYKLSKARENEPLARNAVKYVLSQVKGDKLKDEIEKAIEDFAKILDQSKNRIKKYAADILKDYDVVLTHCHSSTATASLIQAAKANPKLQVVSTETRPLYQGRKTAKELSAADVDVTMIVDSASASFIVDDRYLPVEAVVVGCDEIHKNGSIINKVGTYQIALAANAGKDEFFVVTTLLKINLEHEGSLPNIEIRPAREIWEDAPKDENLTIINPAFEIVPSNLISGYITEVGVLKATELENKLKELYPWV